MKKFKTLTAMRKYFAVKSLAHYHKIMADPAKAEAYRVKRRVYERKRYKKIMNDLKAQCN